MVFIGFVVQLGAEMFVQEPLDPEPRTSDGADVMETSAPSAKPAAHQCLRPTEASAEL